MTVSISPTWWDHLQVAPLTPWWPKLELKIWPHLAESIESEIMDGFWCSRSLNDCIGLPNMIGSFASGATASIVAKNWTTCRLLMTFFTPIDLALTLFLGGRRFLNWFNEWPIILCLLTDDFSYEKEVVCLYVRHQKFKWFSKMLMIKKNLVQMFVMIPLQPN